MSAYDQGISEKLQKAFSDYYNGFVDKDKAWSNFYTSVTEIYPNLTK